MIITRTWAMPNKWTFNIEPIRNLLTRYIDNGSKWIDPFAGTSSLVEYRNDLNPNNHQPSQKEAADFVSEFEDLSLKGAIFDPPYSLTQVSRSYEEMGYKFKGRDNPTGGFPAVRDHISRIVEVNGHCISFGWNTVGIGKKRVFEIVEVLIVSHGGNRNDTLCTVERHMKLTQFKLRRGDVGPYVASPSPSYSAPDDLTAFID